MRFLLLVVVLLVIPTESTIESHHDDNDNMIADTLLQGIVDSVKNNSNEEYGVYFTDSFDFESWWRKFIADLSDDQKENYKLVRFGDVEMKNDNYTIQFTETYPLEETTHIQSYQATVIKIGNNKTSNGKFLINSWKIYES